MENDFCMWISICLIANVVPYWNLLICIWCYFIIQWNKWVKYYCICVYKIPLTSYKITWAKGSSTIVIMCCLPPVRDYFNIIDFSETVERNSMKFDRNVSNPLPNLCFWADWKTRTLPWPLIGQDIFDFFSETAEQNSTKLDRKQALNIHYQVCVLGRLETKMATLASDWPRPFLLLLCNDWTEFNETWWGQDLNISTNFVYLGPMGKQRWLPWPLILWDI